MESNIIMGEGHCFFQNSLFYGIAIGFFYSLLKEFYFFCSALKKSLSLVICNLFHFEYISL